MPGIFCQRYDIIFLNTYGHTEHKVCCGGGKQISFTTLFDQYSDTNCLFIENENVLVVFLFSISVTSLQIGKS